VLLKVKDVLSLRGLSVGARLLLINGLMLLALGIVSVIAWHALDVQSRAMEELATISKAARYHQDADTLHATLRADVNRAQLSVSLPPAERDALGADIETSTNDLRRDLQMLDHLNLPPEIVESQQKVRRIAEAFLSHAVDAGRAALRDPRSADGSVAAMDAASRELREAMDLQTVMMSRHVVAANDDAASAAALAKRWIAGAFLMTTLATGGLVALVSASIRSSMRRLRDVANAMKAGDLGVRCQTAGRDELGQLARALNAMADQVSGMILQLRADAERDAFGTQLVEALEMSDSEEEVHVAIARAMTVVDPGMPMELLIADSSRAHLERATAHPRAGAPGCGVESPFSCVAVRRGNPVVFPDSEALNACARLRGRPCGPVSAACVPVSFMGRSLGVLHATGAPGVAVSSLQLSQLTTLGIQSGARIGTVRAFQKTQRQAATDSLTGLLNRRSVEETVRTLAAEGQHYALLLADLDHFKRLNDTRGHEAGDNALRQFADVLRKTLRGHDSAARWGGEEFVVVLPLVDAAGAAEIANRIRANLAESLLVGGSPAFTASFGVADSSMSDRLEQLIRIADDALYTAKDAGRDRAVIGNPGNVVASVPRRAMEHPAAVDIALVAING
jgi:diguanylate cyclase (GGDEF)-like protein